MPSRLSTLRFLVLIKGDVPGPSERYVFLWDDAYRADLLRIIGRFAMDCELSFTWYDAARAAKLIREQ